MPRPDAIPPECLREVEDVYAELDLTLRRLGYACRACGECCDLVRNQFRLYLSTLELGLILEREGIERLPPQRDGRCGFQTVDGRCGIHKVRPLGCRTFFCTARGRHLGDVYEAALGKLRRLAEKYACVWEYCQKYPE